MKHAKLLETNVTMKHCLAVEKVGQCICFELFEEESNNFLVACAMDKTSHSAMIFTTLRDCHLRSFSDILILMDDHYDFVAKMSRDWMRGLTFNLLSYTGANICDIK